MDKVMSGRQLEKLTVKELREMAMQYPHEEALSEMKKEELIAFLKEAMGLPEEGGDKKGGKGIVKIPKSIVKARIRDLKGKKKEALTSNNHKRAGILRRRIVG